MSPATLLGWGQLALTSSKLYHYDKRQGHAVSKMYQKHSHEINMGLHRTGSDLDIQYTMEFHVNLYGQ